MVLLAFFAVLLLSLFSSEEAKSPSYLITTANVWYENEDNAICIMMEPMPWRAQLNVTVEHTKITTKWVRHNDRSRSRWGFGSSGKTVYKFEHLGELGNVDKTIDRLDSNENGDTRCFRVFLNKAKRPRLMPTAPSGPPLPPLPGPLTYSLEYPLTATINVNGKLMDSSANIISKFSDKNYIRISRRVNQVFTQTDKPMYKPGQLVRIRILGINHRLLPVEEKFKLIYVQNPQKTRIKQWRDVQTKSGLANLEFRLSEEPTFGDWTIKVISQTGTHTRKFRVKEYVLPKYKITIEAPSRVSTEETLKFKVCANYTYGKPVKGVLEVLVDVQSSRWQRITWQVNDFKTSVKDFNGCTEIKRRMSAFSSFNGVLQYSKLKISANLTETLTDVELEAKPVTIRMQIPTISLSFEKTPSIFKPGLPFEGELMVKNADDLPVANENISIKISKNSFNWGWWGCYARWWPGPYNNVKNTDYIKYYTSDDYGMIKFDIPPLGDNSENSNIVAKAVNRDYTQLNWLTWSKQRQSRNKTITSYHYLKRAYSPTNTYMQFDVIRQAITCGSNLTVTLVYNSYKDAPSKIISVTFLSESRVIASESKEITAANEQIRYELDNTSYIAEVNFTIPVGHNVGSPSRLVALYIRNDRESVTAKTNIKVTPCFKNMASIKFVPSQVRPGQSVDLELAADPQSLCALSVVDQSAKMMAGGHDSITPEKVLERVSKNSYYRYWYRRPKIDSEAYCQKWARINNVSLPNSYSYFQMSYGYKDSYETFEDANLVTMGNVHQKTIPCDIQERWWMNPNLNPGIDSTSGPVEGRGGGFFGTRTFAATTTMRFTSTTTMSPSSVVDKGNTDGGKLSPSKKTTLRNYFPETWLWDLVEILDEGKTVLKKDAPHTITSWVGSSFCTNAKTGLGVAKDSNLVTFQPFFLSFTLPYSMVRGETVSFPISVFNYLEQCLNIDVKLQSSEDFEIKGDAKKTLCICSDDAESARFRIKPRSLGKINIAASAEALATLGSCNNTIEGQYIGMKDIVVRKLIIKPEGVPRERTISEFFCVKPRKTPCEEKRAQQKEKASKNSFGSSQYVVQCEIDGRYKTIQCFQLTEQTNFKQYCWCVNEKGVWQGDGNFFPEKLNCEKKVKKLDAESMMNTFRSSPMGLDVPEDVVPDSSRAFVSVIGDLMGSSMDGIGSLVKRPYGCGEQNMVNFSPLSFIMDYLTDTKQLTPVMKDKINRFMEMGYQRELKYRHKNGGYSAFGENSWSKRGASTWLSAFVLRSYRQAKDYVYVDPKQIDDTQDFLVDIQMKDGCWKEVGSVWSSYLKGASGKADRIGTMTSYVLISLIEAGLPKRKSVKESIEKGFKCLRNMPKESDIDSAMRTYAYSLYPVKSREAKSMFSNLMSKVVTKDAYKYWAYKTDEDEDNKRWYWRPSSHDVELTSYGLLAMMKLNGKQSISDALPFVKWLSSQRNAYGGFSSTQDTIMALQVLSQYAVMAYGKGLSLELDVTNLNNDQVANFKVDDSNRLVVERKKVSAPSNLKFQATGMGCALFQANVRYNVKDISEKKPEFDMTVEVINIQNPKLDETTTCLTRGLDICARYTGANDASNMAVVEVNLVSGWIAQKESIKDINQQISEGKSPIDRIEVNDDSLNVYFEKLTHKSTCFTMLIEKDAEVEESKPAYVVVYDYYEEDMKVTEEYKLKDDCKAYETGPIISWEEYYKLWYYRPPVFKTTPNKSEVAEFNSTSECPVCLNEMPQGNESEENGTELYDIFCNSTHAFSAVVQNSTNGNSEAETPVHIFSDFRPKEKKQRQIKVALDIPSKCKCKTTEKVERDIMILSERSMGNLKEGSKVKLNGRFIIFPKENSVQLINNNKALKVC